MIIVSGRMQAAPGQRESLLALSREAMIAARATRGCTAFVVAADPIEADRVNVYEEWESEDALLAFRADGPSADLRGLIVGAEVRRHRIAESGPA